MTGPAPHESAEPELLLSVEGLSIRLRTAHGWVDAVDRVSFTVGAGRTQALVGESGCGKTLTSLAVMGLLPPGVAAVAAGHVRFEGRDLLQLTARERRRIRGGAVAMIFQEPMSCLNPLMSIGEQIRESVVLHTPLRRRAARRRVLELLEQVEISDASRRATDYPHQLSGGMRQRVMIAIALAGAPRLLIADEPTTALDVTTQAGILALLRDIQARLGMAILLITHDLALVAHAADRIAVMYAGRLVEEAPARTLLATPLHPYTRALLDCLPRPELPRRRLPVIPGTVPPLHQMPPGCRFEPRCPVGAGDVQCRANEPHLQTWNSIASSPVPAVAGESPPPISHLAACWKVTHPAASS